MSPGSSNRKYTSMKKAISFAKGLPKLRPFLEVAVEGFRGGYNLSLPMQEIYLHKIIESSSIDELCLLCQEGGIPDRCQPEIARVICNRFQILKYTEKNGLNDVRKEVCRLIENGHVSSEIAQTILLRIFFTEYPDFSTDTRSLLDRLAASEHLCQWGRTMLKTHMH